MYTESRPVSLGLAHTVGPFCLRVVCARGRRRVRRGNVLNFFTVPDRRPTESRPRSHNRMHYTGCLVQRAISGGEKTKKTFSPVPYSAQALHGLHERHVGRDNRANYVSPAGFGSDRTTRANYRPDVRFAETVWNCPFRPVCGVFAKHPVHRVA